MRQAPTPRQWSLKTTQKTHDIEDRTKWKRKLQKHNQRHKLNSPEIYAQLKERETFWQYRLKTIYPIGQNEKEEYL